MAFAVVVLIGFTGCGVVVIDNRPMPAADPATITPLKIGLLLNFSEGATERALERQKAFNLAIKHINAGGGVFGVPVEVAVADSTLDPEVAVSAAQRLIDEEGVHAIVGPSSSANALSVAECVAGPARIPVISPSATSPLLTGANDDGFFFRTALSDSALGPVLARVTRERGFTNVGVIYRDDAWGQSLADAFAAAWKGEITLVEFAPDRTDVPAALRQSASKGAQALVVITFEAEAGALVRESLALGLYDQFTFGNAAKSPALVKAIGGDLLGGMYGTASASSPQSPSAIAWEEAYRAAYGSLPEYAYVKETYDATVALALAAQAAGSVKGAAIRDHLRSIGNESGVVVIAGVESIAAGLQVLAEGGEVNYEGAATSLDWDEHGDLRRGHIGVWRFTADEGIEEVEVIPFEAPAQE
ncbi:MAG: ABC transporter substrate-binding protein [Chloroflexota bacterium]|nr:ABC transporter substrate-binding protein [Chloroflexota bacterium]MDE2932168.1 ABC transporter substrate-binding protein [Chloroflexota bacterium]